MSPKSPINAVVVKKEEKEAKLKAFISTFLGAAPVPAANQDAAPSLLLVARSADSPLVKAVLALSDDIAARGLPVYAILMADAETGAAPVSSLAPHWTIRCLADARFRDAHEQLLLGPATAWIGDCMRRDPAKRDAFENFSEACPMTASNARKSFTRLWNAATPVATVAERVTGNAESAAQAAAALADNPSDHNGGPSAMTRQ